MPCYKAMSGEIVMDPDKRANYFPLLEELYDYHEVFYTEGYDNALITLSIGEQEMSFGEAERLDEIVQELGKYAIKGAKIHTKSEEEEWYIYVGPDQAAIDAVHVEQVLIDLREALNTLWGMTTIDKEALRQRLISEIEFRV